MTPATTNASFPSRSTRSPRRAAAGIASIVILVFLQLAVVGSIVLSTRDQDTTIQRLDTLRSFYAAEAGMNMAIREMINNSDEDGDGTIGTISNDNNPDNDPMLSTARVHVVKTVSGSTSILTSRGRAGVARRQLTTAIE